MLNQTVDLNQMIGPLGGEQPGAAGGGGLDVEALREILREMIASMGNLRAGADERDDEQAAGERARRFGGSMGLSDTQLSYAMDRPQGHKRTSALATMTGVNDSRSRRNEGLPEYGSWASSSRRGESEDDYRTRQRGDYDAHETRRSEAAERNRAWRHKPKTPEEEAEEEQEKFIRALSGF